MRRRKRRGPVVGKTGNPGGSANEVSSRSTRTLVHSRGLLARGTEVVERAVAGELEVRATMAGWGISPGEKRRRGLMPESSYSGEGRERLEALVRTAR
jgi:hypothetical protein